MSPGAIGQMHNEEVAVMSEVHGKASNRGARGVLSPPPPPFPVADIVWCTDGRGIDREVSSLTCGPSLSGSIIVGQV